MNKKTGPPKIKLLIVSPGPRMTIDKNYFRLLSHRFTGEMITTSYEAPIIATTEIHGFRFKCWRQSKYKFLGNISFVIKCFGLGLARRRRGESFDLVMSYDPLKTGVVSWWFSKVFRAKFIAQVNGVYTSDAEYLDAPSGIFSRIKKWIVPRIIRLVIRGADGIKVLFDDQLKPFEEVLAGRLVRRFPSYVDIGLFKPLPETKTVLFVGFPFKRKGVDILIAAFRQISDDFPQWHLKILGWYPDLTELNKAIDNQPKIQYHPPVFHDEMPLHIGSAGIVVLPSRSEAMGRILVESMAAGRPRIGANVDGIPTVINDGVDGLLFESENVTALSEKLRALMGDPELRRRLGDEGRKRAQEEFSPAVYFKNLDSFCSDVIQQPKR